MAALNGTPLGSAAGTGATLDLTNVNPGGSGYVVVIASRMTNSGADATPTISDSVDGSTGWTLIGTSRDPVASFNYAIRAWIKSSSGWSSNRTVTIGGSNTTYSVQAVALHATSITGAGSGLWTTTASIGDGAESGTLSGAPASGDISVAVVAVDGSGNPGTTWGGSYSSFVNRDAGASGGAGFSVGTRTGSTSTSVDITDSYTGGGSFFHALGLAFNLTDDGTAEYIPPPYLPFVVTSNGAALTTNDPAVTFTGYTSVENDLVVLFISSTTVLDLVVNGSLPAGWFGLLGSGVDVNSDAHGMCAVYHFVTSGEAGVSGPTFTCTDALGAAETGYVQGVIIRNVDTTSPIDDSNSTFDSANTVTPHVLASLTGANLLDNSLVVSSVARDGTGAYAGGATNYTTLRADNTNNARWIGYGTALTVAGANWAAQNITPSAGDEYISITAAFTALHRPGRATQRHRRHGRWLALAARRQR